MSLFKSIDLSPIIVFSLLVLPGLANCGPSVPSKNYDPAMRSGTVKAFCQETTGSIDCTGQPKLSVTLSNIEIRNGVTVNSSSAEVSVCEQYFCGDCGSLDRFSVRRIIAFGDKQEKSWLAGRINRERWDPFACLGLTPDFVAGKNSDLKYAAASFEKPAETRLTIVAPVCITDSDESCGSDTDCEAKGLLHIIEETESRVDGALVDPERLYKDGPRAYHVDITIPVNKYTRFNRAWPIVGCFGQDRDQQHRRRQCLSHMPVWLHVARESVGGLQLDPAYRSTCMRQTTSAGTVNSPPSKTEPKSACENSEHAAFERCENEVNDYCNHPLISEDGEEAIACYFEMVVDCPHFAECSD